MADITTVTETVEVCKELNAVCERLRSDGDELWVDGEDYSVDASTVRAAVEAIVGGANSVTLNGEGDRLYRTEGSKGVESGRICVRLQIGTRKRSTNINAEFVDGLIDLLDAVDA